MGTDDSDPAIERDRRRGLRSREEALECTEAGTIARLHVKTDGDRRYLVPIACREGVRNIQIWLTR